MAKGSGAKRRAPEMVRSRSCEMGGVQGAVFCRARRAHIGSGGINREGEGMPCHAGLQRAGCQAQQRRCSAGIPQASTSGCKCEEAERQRSISLKGKTDMSNVKTRPLLFNSGGRRMRFFALAQI